MNQSQASSEPSIEEILDSIRQIIADDDDGAANPATADAAKEIIQSPPNDDIIELTERVGDAAAAAPPAPPEPQPEPRPDIGMTDAEPDLPPPPPKPRPEPRHTMSAEDILTERAENAAVDAFSELAQKASVDKSGGVTIEDIVRYEIRPLLRAWVDKHLPVMVERLLQRELEKISRRFEEE